MSRIGKNPVTIPAGVTAQQASDGILTIKGPKGELSWKPNPLITVSVKETEIVVTRDDESKSNMPSMDSLNLNSEYGDWSHARLLQNS